VYAGKPVIGIAGGIGSGKSFVAGLFGELGCVVIRADDAVLNAYRDACVKHTLRQWWGPLVFDPRGDVDRAAVARKIFTHPSERDRLEKLIHPLVNAQRQRVMKSAADDASVVAFVWDIPLLFEKELNRECDAVVFVDTPDDIRLQRVQSSRGWDQTELMQRENLQTPLDSKRRMSDHVIVNTADAQHARGQVRDVFSRILAATSSQLQRGDDSSALMSGG